MKSSLHPRSTVLAIALMLTLLPQAKGALTLTIDSAAETMSFSGLDTGIPSNVFGTNYHYRWQAGSSINPGTGINVTSGLDVTGGAYSYSGSSISGSDGQLILNVTLSSTAPSGGVTVSGNGTTFSYASWDLLSKNYAASLTSSDVLSLTSGTGVSAVQINAIPEASATPLLVSVSLATLAIVRRRKKK